MKRSVYNLKFITPCLCAGSNQAIAEIRAPSIRGKLRWWFRVLGGSQEQESEVFGSTSGGSSNASAIIVRVSMTEQVSWEPPHVHGMSDEGYLLYFAKVAGKPKGSSGDGPRWNPAGAIGVGSRFQLNILQMRPISSQSQAVLDLAIRSFLVFGSLGLRSTRGLGAFECVELPASEENIRRLAVDIKKTCPSFLIEKATYAGPLGLPLLKAMGAQLRALRKGYSAGKTGGNPTPLGTSNPRQSSAVYLRPVLVGQEAHLWVFEAPALKVLGAESRKGAPRIGSGLPSPSVDHKNDRNNRWR